MPSPKSRTRTQARAAARLAAVQALYQHEMEGTPIPALLHEFHQHRLGATIEDAEYHDADVLFFAVAAKLAAGWSLDRLDKPMRQILRCGTYELIARPDVPVGAVISEYLDVTDAFYDRREKGFVNGLLDAVAKDVRV
jgi:transcription antitermination protein NusB